jgi:cytochrome P450
MATKVTVEDLGAADFQFPFSPKQVECPYPYYSPLRRDAPVYKNPTGGEYIVSRHEDIAWITSHPELFSNEQNNLTDPRRRIGTTVLGGAYQGTFSVAASDPPSHKVKRARMYRGFSPGALRSYEPEIRAITNRLVDAFVNQGECDFMRAYAYPVPMLVICRLLGLPTERLDDFLRWTQAEGQAIIFHTGERLQWLEQNAIEQNMYLKGVVEERHRNPGSDFLSRLIQAQVAEDGEFNLAYILQETSLLFFAGNVTTAHTMGSAMQILLQHPGLMERARSESALIKRIWEETLRLEPPVQWLTRRVVSDVNLNGTEIPGGSRVVILLASGNHDETTFESPEDFNPGRGNLKDHLAFGHGIHFCLGAPLARLEGMIGFETLLARLKNIRPAEQLDSIEHIDSLIFRAPKALHLEFERA